MGLVDIDEISSSASRIGLSRTLQLALAKIRLTSNGRKLASEMAKTKYHVPIRDDDDDDGSLAYRILFETTKVPALAVVVVVVVVVVSGSRVPGKSEISLAGT